METRQQPEHNSCKSFDKLIIFLFFAHCVKAIKNIYVKYL